MKNAQKSQVNRCFPLPPTGQQREEEIKRTLLADAKKRWKRRANEEIEYLIQRHKKTLLQLLPLIKQRHPFWLTTAIEGVEEQGKRNELSMDEIKEFRTFKASLK